MNIFRIDQDNVGDWWSPPVRYIDFKNKDTLDILEFKEIPNETGVHIVGGGSLGRPFFAEHRERLTRADRRYALIAWGVGADVREAPESVLTPEANEDLLGAGFDDFDVRGTRVFGSPKNTAWVPCASCLHPLFDIYRKRAPEKRVGVYFHKRVSLNIPGISQNDRCANNGNDIEEKLQFLSSYEFIITNTYHGVYWSTLLNRKTICVPFKSGLFSFRHKPHYITHSLSTMDFSAAPSYQHALEECRDANIDFFNHLTRHYGAL